MAAEELISEPGSPTRDGLTITGSVRGLVCQLRLAGRLGRETVPLFYDSLDSWVSRGQRLFRIQLDGVTGVDLAGARALRGAAHLVGRYGGQLTFAVPARLADLLGGPGAAEVLVDAYPDEPSTKGAVLEGP